MRMLGWLILAGLVLLGLFGLLNWGALSTPTDLSFLGAHLNAPLGLILLGFTLILLALFTAYVLTLRTTMLLDTRRYTQELRAQSQLAEQAEASRLTALRSQLDSEFAKLHSAIQATETGLRNQIEEATRGVEACVGEMEDKLDRTLPPPR